MNIEFDSAKNALNIKTHGISLADAALLDWDTIHVFVDTRKNYGETRYIGYAYIGNHMYCVIFTIRQDNIRIISLRKANSREVKRYDKT
jgi:uncharacterized DUF497 family protein